MEGENPFKGGRWQLPPGPPRICLSLRNSLSSRAPPQILPGRLAGTAAGGDGQAGRSPKLGVRRPGPSLSPPLTAPWEAACPLCAPIFHLSTERAPHFWDADIGNCMWGSLLRRVSSAQCREGEGRGGVPQADFLTAISLVQAVGAVLDPVAGGHTESVHRAEELSRARWGGRVPLGCVIVKTCADAASVSLNAPHVHMLWTWSMWNPYPVSPMQHTCRYV